MTNGHSNHGLSDGDVLRDAYQETDPVSADDLMWPSSGWYVWRNDSRAISLPSHRVPDQAEVDEPSAADGPLPERYESLDDEEHWFQPPSPSSGPPGSPIGSAAEGNAPDDGAPEPTDSKIVRTENELPHTDASDAPTPEQPKNAVFNALGSGPTYQAITQSIHNYGRGDYVRPVPVSSADLEACSEFRFVAPRMPEQLDSAIGLLAARGVVVLNATPGNGRRTTALRLLRTVRTASHPLQLFDLEPDWSKPDVAGLPTGKSHGYVLDLSEFVADEPDGRFGRDLAAYGREALVRDSFLVILTTPQAWKGTWVEPTLDFTVKLSSPDARALIVKELGAHSGSDRLDWLEDPAFKQIWESNPSAREARRLARIITDAKEANFARIVDEFRGWQDHIEELLNPVPGGPGHPDLLATRAMVWAGALLHGGLSRSVLKAADKLLEKLAVSRRSGDVLADATSSRRLQAARLTARDGRAFHEEDKHDLATAVVQNLWEEFPTQTRLLREWVVSVVADPAIPEEDARRASTMLLQLAIAQPHGGILEEIGTVLVGRRRPLAVETLSAAALDPQIGPIVRNLLYVWAKAASTNERITLVTEICGGKLGVEKPTIALTRLRWAAEQGGFGFPAAISAFSRLASARPDEVRGAVVAWLGDEKLAHQALVVFLALASSDEGAILLLTDASTEGGRQRFVGAWQRLLNLAEARDITYDQMSRWSDLVQRGLLPRDLLIDLFADVYEPDIHQNGLHRFFADDPGFFESFWGRVLKEAIVRHRHRGE
ncbi:hypothetical protein [Embleya sp. AB8]|uniref:hypothetical protein n=1 Tax=Embleya sp. AB8 TaxID=3156304 RepID=UPI003C76183F